MKKKMKGKDALFGLPDSIPLFGELFDVVPLTNEQQQQHAAANGEKLLGLFDPEEQTISIKEGLPPLLRLAVFFHELAHLRLMVTGVGAMLSNEIEEAMCDWVGFWISEMFSNGLLHWGPKVTGNGAT